MQSKKKVKRELKLDKIIFAEHFVLKHTLNEQWGVFFALGRRNAKAVIRNKIKRIFREQMRKELDSDLIKKTSICLISKKKSKFKTIDSELADEINNLATKVGRIYRKALN